ncbi:MAG: HEAT repeat domain-containing protein, partial [Synechococcales cyanobacterium K32_A2020_035]|nr:HEAT repeat domain-containing protein [Synechococcales cyanobacterium K32_A2020_035]
MLFEGWAVLTGLELVSFVGKQVLGLGTDALKDYVKDFFKGSIRTGVMAIEQRRALEQGMMEAIATLTQLFEKELQVRRVDPAVAKAHYREPFKRFLKHQRIREILGAAFESDCKAIDSDALAEIWAEHHPQGALIKPEKIDWDRIGFDYLDAVRGTGGIIETHPELRAVLSIQLQKQEVAALTELAGPKVGFDLTRYRESLLEQYEVLKLESLGASKYERGSINYRTVPLWSVFVAQTAREFETVAPQLFELPKEQLRRMQAEGLIDGDAEEIWQAQKGRYFESSPRSILEIWADPQVQYQVVLGDPGAGKSTLVRYLAVQWARQASSDAEAPIPLLIELRRYIQSKESGECKNFLEFIHQGSNWVGNLNQMELDRILDQGRVLVMFDGLDEVVERGQRGNVLKAIHGFSQTYPQARIIVTSRVIGYRAEDLRGAGFRHFMLQDLDREQMQQFVTDWHETTYSDAAERERKQRRLERAIDGSKAIFELAGNPLLLTLMAILNRGEELPRDRVRLYEKAAEVLLFQWDFEEKEGLVDPRLAKYLVELDFRDKRAMLQQVAYCMQSSPKGLAGNFVTRQVLEDCLVDYLKNRKDAAQAPSIAGLIIEQLRERNFILCALGNDNYAFIHRTFLEYFCATEIVERFGKRGTEGGLTFEQLRDEVFGGHWQDPTWHEVLRLICGEIAPKFAGELIEFLMGLEVDRSKFIEDSYLKKEGLLNLFLAADCLEEVRDRSEILSISQHLLKQLQQEAETANSSLLWFDTASDLLQGIATLWGEDAAVKQWLMGLGCLKFKGLNFVPQAAVQAIAQTYKDDPDTLSWLKDRVQLDDDWQMRSAAVEAIAQNWKDHPDILPWLKDRVQHDDHEDVRSAAVEAIAQDWKDDPDILPWLKDRIHQDDNRDVNIATVWAIAQGWKDDPDTLPWLKGRVQQDNNINVRGAAVTAIAQGWKDHPDTLPWLKDCVQQDDNGWVRSAAVTAIAQTYKDHPDTLRWLKDRVQNDDNGNVRCAAVTAIAQTYKDHP